MWTGTEVRELPVAASAPDRDHLIALLSPSPVDTDDLIRESRLAPAAVTGLLLELELAGKVTRHPQGMVSLA